MTFKPGNKTNVGRKRPDMVGNKFRKGLSSWNKGKKYKTKPCSEETKKKISEAQKGKPRIYLRNRDVSEATRKKLSACQKGKPREYMKGEKNPNWLKDRNKLKTDRLKMYDSRYKIWMKEVKNRDNWKCKINNNDCCGRLEAHHILPWSKFPELRYEVNNGITLCRTHHPRKRNDEIKLVSFFQNLIKAIAQ